MGTEEEDLALSFISAFLLFLWDAAFWECWDAEPGIIGLIIGSSQAGISPKTPNSILGFSRGVCVSPEGSEPGSIPTPHEQGLPWMPQDQDGKIHLNAKRFFIAWHLLALLTQCDNAVTEFLSSDSAWLCSHCHFMLIFYIFFLIFYFQAGIIFQRISVSNGV